MRPTGQHTLTSFSCSLRLLASLSEAVVSSLSFLVFSLKSFSAFVNLFFMPTVSSRRLHLSSSNCGSGVCEGVLVCDGGVGV